MSASRAEYIIQVLRRGDENILNYVAEDLFDNPIDPDLTREFLGDPRHHIVVAIHNGLVVGFASGVHYVHPDKPPELWINEVAVAPPHQRAGVGKAIVEALLDVGRALHCTEAWVLTNAGNAAAVALYTSVGGTQGADESSATDPIVGYSFRLSPGLHG